MAVKASREGQQTVVHRFRKAVIRPAADAKIPGTDQKSVVIDNGDGVDILRFFYPIR